MNDNKTIEITMEQKENESESTLTLDNAKPCAVIATERDTVENEAPPSAEQVEGDSARAPFLARLTRFAFFTLLPSALAAFSITVTLVIVSSFLGNFEISREAIVRLMLGDIAGGVDYVVEAGGNSTVLQEPLPLLSIDSLSDTAAQNSPPSESGASILTLSNETPYTPDMDEILDMPRAVPPLEEIYKNHGEGAPVVLIIHTHATESFADTAADGYRSFEENKSIISVGKVIADKLQESGISTIHCTEIFDSPDFGMAYYNASQAIRSYIKEYPSISYVLDIHRDSIELEDGTSYAPTSITPLGRAAQIMFVVGTDHGGSDHTEWRDNLALASRVQNAVSNDYPGLMRSINLRSASFNEQYTKGSLLIEVGASASTLDEAKLGAKILAEYLAREIIG